MLADLYRGLSLRYGASLEALGPLADRFVRLDADPSTRAWIDDCFARPNGALQLAAQAIAKKVMSDYDANALTGAHDMRVLGADQWRQLVDRPLAGRLLDVGAGDGNVTAELAPSFDEVVTTETSSKMAERLRRRGWTCVERDLSREPLSDERAAPFDTLALLNVLDRAAHPLTLLERLRALATSDARLLVAVPFPLSPHVHVGAQVVDPEELLPKVPPGPDLWERQARAFDEHLFLGTGWEVTRLARAPYLCRGSAKQPVLTLDDALFVCRPA
ncbi:MAG: methyltransferase domain-containing protein [Myxococcales bacterium]|nr:methyltransferase domain-containing protein [Myxococcales bacterium]